ncbi:DUF808 domain-containing protein [Roseateles sp. BYS180W]|uniref:DUF808 domain-containing protein n=1 Tax=Roseateles rivi TaxID=3299028 RepID=A0ABW7FR59_9BURK
MATSLLALLDDITTVLDDVALLSKAAAKKTSGVLGDDLALNAQQVSGVAADRELPVVWAVAKGSLLNKAILVPLALVISAIAPWAVTPLLMLGGAYLCFEGAEKLVHRWFSHEAPPPQKSEASTNPPDQGGGDGVETERDKIRGAIRTDFILSAEIIAITLGTVADAPFMTRVMVLCGMAVVMTIGVYGLVGGIVKLDDAGLALSRRASRLAQGFGRAILAAAPLLMRTLSVAGTVAMFLVGGGILTHGLPALHHALVALSAGLPGWAQGVSGMALDGLVGLAAGVLLVALLALGHKLKTALNRPAGRAA